MRDSSECVLCFVFFQSEQSPQRLHVPRDRIPSMERAPEERVSGNSNLWWRRMMSA